MNKLFISLNIQRFAASGSISCSVLGQQDVANNKSNVRITFTVTRTSGSTYWNDQKTVTIHCDGQTKTTSVNLPSNKKSNSCYCDFEIGHNPDGTKSISFDASVTTGTGAGTITASGSTQLPTIPRYFSQTPNCWLISYTETTATFGWSTSETCNWVRYHLDGSAGWVDVFSGSGTSGTFTISGLTATTQHNVYAECRRQDSGLWSPSVTAYVTLLDYPKPTNSPDFTIGTELSINVSNPLGRTYTLTLVSNVDGSTIGSYTGTKNGNVKGFNNEPTKIAMYNSIPNSPSGTYYAKVVCSETSTTKTYGNGTYLPNQEDGPEVNLTGIGYEDVKTQTLALTGDNQKLIQGYSTIQVTIPSNNKPTPKYGASIRGYVIQNGDFTSDEVPEEDGEDIVLTCPAQSSIIKIYAYDTRSVSGNDSIENATIIEYTPIEKNTNPKAERCDAQGHPNGVGEYVKLTYSGKYWNQSFGDVTNSIQSVTYQYLNNKTPSAEPSTGLTTMTPTTSNDTYSYSNLVLGDAEHGFNVANSYTIWVKVKDYLSETTFTMTLTNGTPHISYSPNGVCIMGMYDESVGGLLQVGGQPISGGATGDTLPIGSIMPYTSTTIPENWLECNGQAISRTTYADLFRVIGTTFGTGDGSTTFNLPNFKGRVPAGYNSSETEFNSLGKTGGAKSVILSVEQMPKHSHLANGKWFDGAVAHNHGSNNNYFNQASSSAYQGTSNMDAIQNTGGDQAHNNLQPYITTVYIIKAFQSAGVVAQVNNVQSSSTTDVYSCSYINNLINMFYPIGSYYETSDTSFNPNTAWGGTWVEDSKGRVTVGQDTTQAEFDTIGETGGAKAVTLQVEHIPPHSHGLDWPGTGGSSAVQFSATIRDVFSELRTKDTGGGQAHNNLQPYIVVKRWHRTA